MPSLSSTQEDEKDWYDKDLNDFDDLQSSDDDYTVQYQLIQSTQKLCSKNSPIIEHSYHGKDYPFDIWYLIAMHIAPEDVGRFALICRSSNQVVNTVPFWIALFRKYDKIEAKKISRILIREQLTIVRTYVVRSLYQSYSLFQQRFNRTDPIQKDPHFLLSSRCIRIWYSKRPTQRHSYNYYFEFRFDNNQQSNQLDMQVQPMSTILDTNKQLLMNKDNYILHVISSTLVAIGPFMGMTLSELKLNISSDYRYHALRMWFNSSKCYSTKPKYNNSVIVIDPVLCLRIYKWYNCPPDLD